jgi:hypothetical protein
MNGREANEALDRRPVADVWRHTLLHIPSVYGRLAYLASLRNPNSGQYEHHGLAMMFGADEANRALKESHSKVFSEWLSFNLEEQMADVELYLSDLPEERKTVLRAWTKLEPYKNWLPAGAKKVQRRLYLSDLRTILELLRRASGVDGPDPASSPLP